MSSTKNKARQNPVGRREKTVDRHTPGGRVRAARKRKRWTTTDLAERAKIHQSNISRIENNLIEPDTATWIRLAQVLGDSFNRVDLEEYARGPVTIPIVAIVAAGVPIDETIENEEITLDPRFIRVYGDMCGLKARGNSMVSQHILDADILVCRRTYEPVNGSIVVVDFKDGLGATVKFWHREKNKVTLSSNKHPTAQDRSYSYSAAKLGKVFEVLGLVRNLKQNQ